MSKLSSQCLHLHKHKKWNFFSRPCVIFASENLPLCLNANTMSQVRSSAWKVKKYKSYIKKKLFPLWSTFQIKMHKLIKERCDVVCHKSCLLHCRKETINSKTLWMETVSCVLCFLWQNFAEEGISIAPRHLPLLFRRCIRAEYYLNN